MKVYLNATHAKRITHACVERALKDAGVSSDRALALADAYTSDFIERVQTYTTGYESAAAGAQ